MLGYPGIDESEEAAIRAFLEDCVVLDLTTDVKREAVAVRRATHLALPDAIVAATALVARMPLFSADRAFTRVGRLELLLYEP